VLGRWECLVLVERYKTRKYGACRFSGELLIDNRFRQRLKRSLRVHSPMLQWPVLPHKRSQVFISRKVFYGSRMRILGAHSVQCFPLNTFCKIPFATNSFGLPSATTFPLSKM